MPQDAVSRLEEDELRPLAGRPELKGRFSHEFLAAIDKTMSVPRRDRWQSAREWMDHLSGAQRAREEAERKALEAALQRTKSKDKGIIERIGNIIDPISQVIGCAVLGAIFGAIIGGSEGAIAGAFKR